MKTIVLASRNKHKEVEIKKLFEGTGIQVKGLSNFPGIPEVEEDGETLEENALIKARKIFNYIHLPVISDDTGLEVFALDMAPGVYSARYSGKNAVYEDNNRKLLRAMKKVAREKRGARFRCVSAFVTEKIEHITEGICKGRIIEENRGKNGFGYDPLFIPEGYDKTFAELSIEIKNTISHRARAFMAMREFLSRMEF